MQEAGPSRQLGAVSDRLSVVSYQPSVKAIR